MLIPIRWNKLSENERIQLLQRPFQSNELKQRSMVNKIIENVRMKGDMALKRMTKKYDGIILDSLQVSAKECTRAWTIVSTKTRQAMERVIQQLFMFHKQQKPNDFQVETSAGIICESKFKPIQRVGFYIPGGSAPLVSTVLMLGIPAQIANCPLRVLCSPPQKEGKIDPHILVAANLCGINQIYSVGGAQAIAAMAYGTESIPTVDKIFGPGNSWVTQAKMQVAQDPAGATCDLPAGPSEVLIIADHTAKVEFIAADVLSQAEHGPDSQVILLCTDIKISKQVRHAIQRQLKLLMRCSIATQALKNSRLILVDTIQQAVDIANQYAPEHLIMQIDQPRRYLDDIQHAGSVFLGPWTPETAGDYASGTNHVLPTYGYAKSLSGLSVRDFMKALTIQEITQQGLADLAETIRQFTLVEGLDAHQRAIDIRLTKARIKQC